MKKILLIITTFLFLIACGGVKKTQEALNTGNYDLVIQNAIDQLKKNKTSKRKQQYVILLQEAYAKALNRDLSTIKFLKADGNPEKLEDLYNTYLAIRNRQETIKPLLPLPILEKGTNAKFKMQDYSSKIINTKNQLSEYLYTNATSLLNTTKQKYDYRKVYDDFKYINDISPNYKNVRQLMEEAHVKGTDFVLVTLNNNTDKVIPKRLEDDLLNFNTYGLNDLWTVYHANEIAQKQYDFGLILDLREINISPEQIREKQIIKEKQIKDGWEYATNDNGNVLKDSLGNKIKIDKFKMIRCELYEFTQFKSTRVAGQVKYINYKSKQLIEAFPISSEFAFEHIYANFDGDRRALEQQYIDLTNNKAVPFPSNEQMVYDTGEDLKAKLKSIITRNKFR
ncbi:hypothetical protein IMCC3317_01700 [Kordia antarctica]|uniref:Lipoprotein n=1 Tax=Kordia antarctica TaxID=1218801 RepID=A0A7L4ZF21_9FLAO|nr:hypothetical protein [Kordia antarctica]QHI34826.1 hypothetical protein IMCC3317_01700 [Kordia antarctica]